MDMSCCSIDSGLYITWEESPRDKLIKTRFLESSNWLAEFLSPLLESWGRGKEHYEFAAANFQIETHSNTLNETRYFEHTMLHRFKIHLPPITHKIVSKPYYDSSKGKYVLFEGKVEILPIPQWLTCQVIWEQCERNCLEDFDMYISSFEIVRNDEAFGTPVIMGAPDSWWNKKLKFSLKSE